MTDITGNRTLLNAEHIRKAYSGRDVLTDICLDVRRGEAVALVGENGCGKSTMLRILCGVTSPTGGRLHFTSTPRLSFIPDRFEKINMTVRLFLEHMRQLENVDPKVVAHYAALFSMDANLDTPLKYLSKGMLQKVAVIQALLGPRDILLMDEPLSGQDAVSQLNFADEIRRRRKEGMAVVMACHEPFLIEALADRVLQIRDGVLIDGTDYLTQSSRPRCAVLIMPAKTGNDITALVSQALPHILIEINRCGQMLRIEADRIHGPAILDLMLQFNIRIVKYEEAL